MMRRPPRSTPFPHPAPFRSRGDGAQHPELDGRRRRAGRRRLPGGAAAVGPSGPRRRRAGTGVRPRLAVAQRPAVGAVRSEEHTSELQSRQYLVCRLLLDKQYVQALAYPLFPRVVPIRVLMDVLHSIGLLCLLNVLVAIPDAI